MTSSSSRASWTRRGGCSPTTGSSPIRPSASRVGGTTSLPTIRTIASNRYGAVPPRTRGDLAFLLHMLAVTNAQGMVGVVMPHGVLFRGGAEGKIRQRNRGGGPARGGHRPCPQPLLWGQHPRRHLRAEQGQACTARRGKTLFVDAAQEGCFRQGKAQNFMDPGHIARIVEAYTSLRGRGRFRPRRRP